MLGKVISKKAGTSAPSIATHHGFVPLIAVWFAAFLGLAILVLPGAQIARITMAADLTFLGGFSRLALALVASVIGGVVGYLIAVAIQNVSKRQSPEGKETDTSGPLSMSDTDHTSERSRLIVPSKDLGSTSFDEPVSEHPMLMEPDLPSDEEIFADFERPEHPREEYAPPRAQVPHEEPEDRHDWDDPLTLEELESEWADPNSTDDAWVESEPDVSPAPDAPAPFDLVGIAGTAEAVRNDPTSVEDTAVGPEPEILALTRRVAKGSALEALRGKRPEDLSLVQMVERFAAALHERQAKAPNDSSDERDAALAEGLRALALLARQQPKGSEAKSDPAGAASTTQTELRDALEKLRDLSGAA